MLTLVLLISHTISDFILQSRTLVEGKSKFKVSSYFKHGLGLLMTSIPILILLDVQSWDDVIRIIFLVIFGHLIIDLTKEKTNHKIKSSPNRVYFNLQLFILDQIAHIGLIIIMSQGIILEYNSVNQYLLENFFNNDKGISAKDLKVIFEIMYISLSGAFLIPLIFDCIYAKINRYSEKLNEILKKDISADEHSFIDEVKTGRWIGILERALIVIFIIINQVASIGFIIAIKSLARFKMMENKIFSEYYLLGTLFSVAYTLIVFILFERIISI